jgi:hypothetical protein
MSHEKRMLQFLVGDHFQGYGLPSIRRRLKRYQKKKVSIDEDGVVIGSLGVDHEGLSRAIAVRMFCGHVEILYEDGTESFYGSPGIISRGGVGQRYNYILMKGIH